MKKGKKTLTTEEQEKRERLLSEVSSRMITLMKECNPDISEDHFPWNEDLTDVFDGEEKQIAMYSRSLHDYFEVEPVFSEVEPVFPMFQGSRTFETLDELYFYIVYLVLEKHGLLRKDEKLR